MANRILQSFLNPVKFYNKNPVDNPKYRSRHMDMYPYFDTIQEWQTKRLYAQPWQKSDSINLQFISSYSPLVARLITAEEDPITSLPFVQKQQDFNNPDFFIYELTMPLTAYTEGIRFIEIDCGSPLLNTLISEPLDLRILHSGSILLEYTHFEDKGGIIFQTGFAPMCRVKGFIDLKEPASEDAYFEEQDKSVSTEDSKPFEVYTAQFGNTGKSGTSGIPNWYAKLLNRILGCSDVLIDGLQYSKFDGSKMEPSSEKNYPLRAWSIDLMPSDNRDSIMTENEGEQVQDAYIISLVDNIGFGSDDASGTDEIKDYTL